jgi:hypothetical protein
VDASSYGSQRKMILEMEEAIVDFGLKEEKRLAVNMPQKDMSLAEDEFFKIALWPGELNQPVILFFRKNIALIEARKAGLLQSMSELKIFLCVLFKLRVMKPKVSSIMSKKNYLHTTHQIYFIFYKN